MVACAPRDAGARRGWRPGAGALARRRLPAPGPGGVAAPIPEKRLTHTGGRGGGGEALEGSQGAGCSCGRPSPSRPRPPPRWFLASSGRWPLRGLLRSSRSPLAPPGRSGPGLRRSRGRSGVGARNPHPAAPSRWEGAKGNLRASLPLPRRHLQDLAGGVAPPTRSTRIWTRQWPNTPVTQLLYVFHRAWATHTYGHLDIDLAGREPRNRARRSSGLSCGIRRGGRRRQVNSPGAFSELWETHSGHPG